MDHFLSQIFSDTVGREFTDQDRRSILIRDNRIFRHQVLRINYTTYDVRRNQDSINIRTQSDVMVLADNETNGHPYWYARVIGIFHAMVRRSGFGNEWEKRDFLWVRWYGLETSHQFGFKAKRLPRIGFVDTDDNAFGFIDPANIIRAVHLIPAFYHGLTSELLPASMARRKDEDDQDYNRYYVNM